MGIGERIVEAIRAHQQRRSRAAPGAIGKFHRDGGNELLFDVPVKPGEIVVDAGGYRGEWSMRMLARYGCRLVILEPIPGFVERLRLLFGENPSVTVRAAALGGRDGRVTFQVSADRSSAFIGGGAGEAYEAELLDVASLLLGFGSDEVACLKLNIEGGEYDVLERLIETGLIARCRTVLVQFHRQPEGWEARLAEIERRLAATHARDWSYPLVWDRWRRRELAGGGA